MIILFLVLSLIFFSWLFVSFMEKYHGNGQFTSFLGLPLIDDLGLIILGYIFLLITVEIVRQTTLNKRTRCCK